MGFGDQYRQAGPAPGGFGYGTFAETEAEYQMMGSDTSNVYGYSTHGTHVAGIAGGVVALARAIKEWLQPLSFCLPL